jgi:ABC-2 type transport system ATP-binding protein
MAVLQVKNLTKRFGSFTAVDSISFELREGEVLGLLGPNGAGKTTTIQILLGITTPNSGEIRYFEKDFSQNRQDCLQMINYTSAFNTLQSRTTVWENLLVFANLYLIDEPKKKIMELVEYFEIKDLLDSQYKYLSSGEKTRVNFIKALLNDPKIILMDEPTASLDPDIADKTLSLIEQIKKNKKISILYTSHNMNEIDRICDRVIFLSQGKIVAEDTPLNLTKKIETTTLRLTFDKGKKIIEKYLIANKQEFEFSKDNIVIIKTKEKLVPKLIFGISSEGIWMTDIEIQKPTLEDVFLQISRNK